MNFNPFRLFLLAICLVAPSSLAAEDKGKIVEDWQEASDEWIKSDEGRKVISNIITWQNANGGWYKSYNTLIPKPADYKIKNHPLAPPEDNAEMWMAASTIDNGATYSELRLLARAVHFTQRKDAQESFDKGIAYLLGSQYPNGGFPQRFPLQKNYGRCITFNDDAMANVLELMNDIQSGKAPFDFTSEDLRQKCRESFARGIDCIIKCQVKKDGKLTAWGQQHDPDTLAPAKARTYELPSLASMESAGLMLLLMKVQKPSDEVKAAINAGAAWFDQTKMLGKRYEKLSGPQYENGFERRLIDDPAAPPYWARFYDLETNTPMFVDRDGSIHKDVNGVGYERRANYSWFNTRGNSVLKAYAKWQKNNP